MNRSTEQKDKKYGGGFGRGLAAISENSRKGKTRS